MTKKMVVEEIVRTMEQAKEMDVYIDVVFDYHQPGKQESRRRLENVTFVTTKHGALMLKGFDPRLQAVRSFSVEFMDGTIFSPRKRAA